MCNHISWVWRPFWAFSCTWKDLWFCRAIFSQFNTSWSLYSGSSESLWRVEVSPVVHRNVSLCYKMGWEKKGLKTNFEESQRLFFIYIKTEWFSSSLESSHQKGLTAKDRGNSMYIYCRSRERALDKFIYVKLKYPPPPQHTHRNSQIRLVSRETL